MTSDERITNFFQEMKRIKFDSCLSPKKALLASQIVSMMSAARNVILIVMCSIVAYIWDDYLGRGKITLTSTNTR
jgi:hypothetical protein